MSAVEVRPILLRRKLPTGDAASDLHSDGMPSARHPVVLPMATFYKRATCAHFEELGLVRHGRQRTVRLKDKEKRR